MRNEENKINNEENLNGFKSSKINESLKKLDEFPPLEEYKKNEIDVDNDKAKKSKIVQKQLRKIKTIENKQENGLIINNKEMELLNKKRRFI